jgi:hypothetical protein
MLLTYWTDVENEAAKVVESELSRNNAIPAGSLAATAGRASLVLHAM